MTISEAEVNCQLNFQALAVPALTPGRWERAISDLSLSFEIGHVCLTAGWAKSMCPRRYGRTGDSWQLVKLQRLDRAGLRVSPKRQGGLSAGGSAGTSPSLPPSLRTSYVCSRLVSPFPSQLKIQCVPRSDKCFRSVHMAYGLHLSLIQPPPRAVFPDALCSVQLIRRQALTSFCLFCKW